jgi:phenylacetate-CoA ligase
MSIAKKIYYHAPYFLKVLFLNIQAMLLYRNRYSGNFRHMLEQHKKLWTSDFYAIRLFQQGVLRDMLQECREHSPWYGAVMEEHGITEALIRKDPEDALFRMPALTKKQHRKHAANIAILEDRRPTTVTRTTSGTTGTPLHIAMDRDTQQRTFAYLHRYYWSIGLPQKFRSARFTGNNIVPTDQKKPPFWVPNYFDRQLFMSSYHLSDENLAHYVRKLNRFRPHLLDGYPSTIYILARYILASGVSLDFSPVAISVTAETLYDEQRKTIEKAFGAKVFNQHASAEGSPMISECREGKLHLHLDTGYFEYRMREEHAEADHAQLAELVITGFRNRKMPLIRYEIGDLIEVGEGGECPCGCQMPLVRQIVGREDDFFVNESGGLIGRVASVLFKHARHVTRGQIIQNKPSEFEILVETEEGFGTADEQALIDRTREIMGASAQVTVRTVDQIPAGAGGKLRAAIRRFPLDRVTGTAP